MLIALLTDFGAKDEYVGVCKLVIKQINPHAEVVDISHEVYSFDILTGSWMLYNIVDYLPQNSIVLPIVDPGVGSERKGIIVETDKDITFVGPDNGIIIPSAEKLRIKSVWEIEISADNVSPTFHARDIFSPVAARLSTDIPASYLGKRIEKKELVHIKIKGKRIDRNHFNGEIMHIDHFGTVRTNIPFNWLEEAGIKAKKRAAIITLNNTLTVSWYQTFSAAKEGELLLLSDSFGWLSIAKNAGRADSELKLHPHDTIAVVI